MASLSTERVIGEQFTQVHIKHYGDCIFVIVTQSGKLGCLIQVSLPPTAPLALSEPDSGTDPRALPPISAAIQLTNILGQAPSEHLQTLHSLYASQIATLIWSSGTQLPAQVPRRNVILAISLVNLEGNNSGVDDAEKVLFMSVMEMVQELLAKK